MVVSVSLHPPSRVSNIPPQKLDPIYERQRRIRSSLISERAESVTGTAG